MLQVSRYNKTLQGKWDDFVEKSRNGTFLFKRDFMEYHSDRFTDHSLVITENDSVIALIPANQDSNKVYSHAGLTYGGLVIGAEQRLADVLKCFHSVLGYYKQAGIDKIYYKQLPYYYCSMPSSEDDYALFILRAKLYRRDMSFLLEGGDSVKLQKGKKSNISKAKKEGVEINASTDYKSFWKEVLEPNLESTHKVKPVHTSEEIVLLAKRFPQNIKLYVATLKGQIVAGTVLFINNSVVNVQYISANEKGKNTGALDYLFSYLLDEYNSYRYFNFGIANERDGLYLNAGLAQWKEGFGARAASHNFYEIDTNNYSLLEKYVG